MGINRITRVNELLHREISASLYHVIDEDAIDRSAVTVTHVITAKDLRQARVLVSIFGHENEREAILATLRRHRKAIQDYVSSKVVLKYTPRLNFVLDSSVEQGDHVLNLLDELEIPEPDEAAGEDDGEEDHGA